MIKFADCCAKCEAVWNDSFTVRSPPLELSLHSEHEKCKTLPVTAPDTALRGADNSRKRQLLTTAQWATPILAVSLTAVWILWGANEPGATSLILLLAALAAYVAMLASSRAGTAVPLNLAIALSGLAILIAALAPIHHSRDLYLYNSYGRLVAEHHLNPFFNPPNSAPADSTLRFVAPRWQEQNSMYGPAFIGLAAVIASLAGTSELAIRLAWQGVMASAAFAAVVMIARRTNSSVAVLALGCSPVILATVNDAHNDLLIGLGLLAVALLVEDRRYGLASAVAALAIAIKLPVAVPILAIIAWVFWRRGTRPTLRFAVPIAMAVTAAYLLAGGIGSLRPIQQSAGDDSRFSLWRWLRTRQIESLQKLGETRAVASDAAAHSVSRYSLIVLVVCVVILLWRYRRAKHPGEAATIAGLLFCISAAYVMPWYAAMLLPVAMLAWNSRATLVLQVQAFFLLISYANGAGHQPLSAMGQFLEHGATWINLALLLLVLFWARPSEEADLPLGDLRNRFWPAKTAVRPAEESLT